MASDNSAAFVLPKVPVPHKNFASFIKEKHGEEIQKFVAPYNQYEAKLREGFAQHREHEALQDPKVNAVPIFEGDNDVLRVRARTTDDQSRNEKYIMPLNSKDRKPEGAPATVQSMQDFKKNFNLFSESSLADLDWSNVVAAGSSVVTALLPVPDECNASKKAHREYYHQMLAPSSDVDLFIWGLDEDSALEKVKQIECSVRNSILEEVTTVRTKNAITIVSRYPIRHVQIVLRLYKSVSEILSGFDVDCSCFAYDGNQVYGTPRAITAFITQTNTIDLSRRSPSYESRLSKYARRGFEGYWPELDRSKIDPTVFERSFSRTMGLARLLVLEQLPKPNDREQYMNQRREERGRPSADNRYWNRHNALPDNVKDQDPDDMAEWVYDDEVSNYHSFTIPYGPKYNAKKIEKLLYTKDLLLNAEWNRNKDRTVDLHRHPCFIGPIDSVIYDCCGSCPEPVTDDEREIAEEENKIYVFGDMVFMKDDPGRQTIGSFHPLTDDDWTDMAYISNTQELCQKICDGDLGFVEDWCERNRESIDRRDHTGRTPLHLAAQCSSPEMLKCFVDHGARIVARLVHGMTALHIAAARGSVDMVSTLLEHSEENEAAEDEKEQQKKTVKHETLSATRQSLEADDREDQISDVKMDDVSSDEDTAMTEGSFVKVTNQKPNNEDALDNADDTEPDIYDVNVIAWDTAVSALHLAILGGHTEVIKVLVSRFGADVLLPVKLIDSYYRDPKAAIMTLILAARLSGSTSTALDVTKELLGLGASSAQGDMQHVTAFHYLVAERKVKLLKACFELDGAASRTALDHMILEDAHWQPRSDTPLTTAIRSGNSDLANALLDFGAKPIIDLDDYATAYSMEKEDVRSYWRRNNDMDVSEFWKKYTEQPVFLAVECDMPDVIINMVDAGADVNTIDTRDYEAIAQFEDDDKRHLHGGSLLDAVNAKISSLENSLSNQLELPKPTTLEDDLVYFQATTPGSYERWYLCKTVEVAKNVVKEWEGCIAKKRDQENSRHGRQQKLDGLRALQERFIGLKDQLLQRGAKTVKELHPETPVHKHDEDKGVLKQEKTFEPKVSFQVSSTGKIREGYLQLFEAAWEGSSDQIKRLTLANWGPDQKNNPLMVAVQDSKGFTPFAIAIYRRHFEVAKMILEIANAQFKGSDDESTKRRYTIADNDSDSEPSDDEDELEVSSRVVDETYTFDNIAALKQSVGSKVSASELLSMSAEVWCLLDLPEGEAHQRLGYLRDFSVDSHIREGTKSSEAFRQILALKGYASWTLGRYAIVSRDHDLLRFWLGCCQEGSKMKSNSNVSSFCGFDTSDFQFALEHGLIEELTEMIRIAGAELPLEALAKQSGVQQDEKPKYYQGLSIGGKKMPRWARAHGDKSYQQAMGERTPPLLQAAYHGGLVAVEWCLSDTPFRLYKEYGVNNADDPRLKTLAKALGGFDQAISSWLKRRSIAPFPPTVVSTNTTQGNLSLHAAVLSSVDSAKSLPVLKYLLSVFPTSIDLPSASTSLTPLALSFLTGRTPAAEALISAGADQTTRDSTSKNLIHLSLIAISKTSPADVSVFRALLALIDKRLLSSLFTERCRDSPGGLTPLAYWLASIKTSSWASNDAKLVPEVLSVMLEFGGEEALRTMDGSGQFPLHQAVKHSYTELVKLMLAHDPALLAMENAMGQTPLELAESLFIRDCTKDNPDIKGDGYRPLEDRRCEEFIDEERDGEEENDVRQTWKLCRECARENPRRRKLIGVSEAREVARRLAERKKAESEVKERVDKGEVEEEVKKDEVDGWLAARALQMG